MNVSRDDNDIDIDEKKIEIDSRRSNTHLHVVDVLQVYSSSSMHYEEHGDIQLLLIKSFPFRSPFCLLRGFFV